MGQGIGTLFGFLAGIVLARSLGPSGRGTYALLTLASATLILAINLGLGQASVYYIGNKSYSSSLVASNLLALSLIIGIPTAVVSAVVVVHWGMYLFPDTSPMLIFPVILSIPFALSRLYSGQLFTAQQDFRRYNLLVSTEQIFRFALLLIVWMIGLGTIGAIWAFVATSILFALIGWKWVSQKIAGLRLVFDKAMTKKFVSYGIRSYSTILLAYLNLRFDMFLVGFFAGASSVGLYAVAVSISELVRQISNMLVLVLFSRIPSLSADDASRLTNLVARCTMTVVVMATIVILLLGNTLISILFGNEFQSAQFALTLLLPGVALSNLGNVLYSDIAGRGKPEIGIYATVASLTVMLIADFLMIPYWGINGAAFASTISYSVSTVILVGYYLIFNEQSLRSVLFIYWDDLSYIRSYMTKVRLLHP